MNVPATGTLSVEGATLCYEMRGSGPSLLLIPGGGCDAGIFDGIAGTLAGSFTVISFDPRGHSRSPLDGSPEDQRAEIHGEDASRLLARLAPEAAFIFGSSSGAIAGLDLARPPWLTACVFAVTAAVSAAQLADHSGLAALERTPRWLSGDWWRSFTALFAVGMPAVARLRQRGGPADRIVAVAGLAEAVIVMALANIYGAALAAGIAVAGALAAVVP